MASKLHSVKHIENDQKNMKISIEQHREMDYTSVRLNRFTVIIQPKFKILEDKLTHYVILPRCLIGRAFALHVGDRALIPGRGVS